MPRVLVTPHMLNGVRGPAHDILASAGFEVVFPAPDLNLDDPDTLLKELEGIDAVVASTEPYTQQVLKLSKLRAIARTGVGYDAIDMKAATDLGVVVTITVGANEQSVAETAMALLLGVFRGFPERDRHVREGVWHRDSLPRLMGRTMGLVGLGRIGRAMIPKAQGMGLKVIGYDPMATADQAKSLGIELLAFEDLLKQADIVSLHLPCVPETQDLINARTLGLMKRGSVLINSSRGGLVDEPALVEAIRSGHLFGAGLDVFKEEPLPTNSPLTELPHVLLSPHNAGLDEDSERDMGNFAAALADLYTGTWPEIHVVNKSLGPNWKW